MRMQLYYPGPEPRLAGEHQVTVQPNGEFATIVLSDDGNTFLFADENDIDRLANACASAKAQFAAIREARHA